MISDPIECIRCGSCKVICPTFEAYSIEPMSARGRVALLLGLSSGKLKASPTLNDRIFSCTLCGICTFLCPSGVDVKEIIYRGRGLLSKSDKKRRYLRFLTRLVIKYPRLSFSFLSFSQNFIFPYLIKKGLLPFKLDLPEYYFMDKPQVFTLPKKRGRVAVFTGCTINYLLPHLCESLVNVLKKLGYEVIFPAGEACCGVPLRSLGLEKEAIELAKKNLKIFNRLNVEAVVSLCPTCTLSIKKEYPKLIGEGITNAVDISTFLNEKINPEGIQYSSSPIKNIIYHDPCHLKYGLGIEKEPRNIIRTMGFNLKEPPESQCCGFAGTFCFSNKGLSLDILQKCLDNYLILDPEAIVTTCPGCIIQLSRGLKNKPVFHLIELVEEAILQESV